MRKFVLVVDAAMAALCLTLAVVQAVVCILYLFVLDLSPTLRGQMSMLLGSTAIFAVVGLLFLAGFLGLLKHWRWHWPLQGLVVVATVPAALGLYSLLT